MNIKAVVKICHPGDAESLEDMIVNGIEIRREIFVREVNEESLSKIEEALEGNKRLHITYYISKLNDEPIYFLKHSDIAYVF